MLSFAGSMIRTFISKMNSFNMSTDTRCFTDSEEDTKTLDSQSVQKINWIKDMKDPW